MPANFSRVKVTKTNRRLPKNVKNLCRYQAVFIKRSAYAVLTDRRANIVCDFFQFFAAVVHTDAKPCCLHHLQVIQAVVEEFPDLKQEEALVLMGHGTTHYANSIYAALDYTFKDKGHKNIFLGTVEAYPSMETLMKMVKDYHPSKVILAPFMIVAGDHAKNDMAGDDPDSWYSQFAAAGFEVEAALKGLGEYPGIRRLLVEHLKAADSE